MIFNLSLEENDFLIALSDPAQFNPFRKEDFSFSFDVDLLCTRLLANQFLDLTNLNTFLLFQYLAFKKHLITDKQLSYFLVASMQLVLAQKTGLKLDTSNVRATEETVSMQDYFSDIKDALDESDTGSQNRTTAPTLVTGSKLDRVAAMNKGSYHPTIQPLIDKINQTIETYLPDSHYTYPEMPIFLISKFLDKEVCELIEADVQEIYNLAHTLGA